MERTNQSQVNAVDEGDDDHEVLFALRMALEHDERHQALALRTWMPRIEQWYFQHSEVVARLRVQLAGCSTAALGWVENEAKREDYGWSAAYQDVLDLRDKYERLKLLLHLRDPKPPQLSSPQS